MVKPSSVTLDAIKLIARRLDYLRKDVVLVGGAATGLLITSTAIPKIRSTIDIDVIVEITTRSDYYILEDKLRDLGFRSQIGEGIPMCRWTVDNVIVDIMPTNLEILGFSNTWYSATIDNSMPTKLDDDLEINIAKAPYFIATKIEAFQGRGHGDYMSSHDIEDIITIIDGRAELIEEIDSESQELKSFLSQSFEHLLSDEDFLDSLPGHLLPDEASQARLSTINNLIHEIVRIGK